MQPSPREEVTIDDALRKNLGEFGLGQRYVLALASLASIPSALQNFMMVFSGLDPAQQGWWRCTAPDDEACAALQLQSWPDLCSLPRSSWAWTYRGNSIVSEFDLVCADAWMVHLSSMGFFMGWMAGSILFSCLAQEFGRRRSLGMACALTVLLGLASALAPTFWWLFVLRTLAGAAAVGIAQAAFLLGTEPVGPSWRAPVILAMGYSSAFGGSLLSLMAFLLPSWRMLMAAAALVAGASLCLVVPSIPESPRWLLAMGRKGDALAALAAIASRNRTHLPEAPLADAAPVADAQRGLMDAVVGAPRFRRRTAVMAVAWAAVHMMYYGVTLLISYMEGDPFLNQFLGFALEAPALLAATLAMGRLGRRSTAVALMLQGGVACLLCALTGGWLRLAFAVAAKICAAAALGLLRAYTEELFPANIRAANIQACSLMGSLGSVAAPGFLLLGFATGATVVPYLVFGSLVIAAGVAIPGLPETLDAPTPETVQELPGIPTRKYKLAPLRHIFRTRTAMPAPLHPFIRMVEADTDDTI